MSYLNMFVKNLLDQFSGGEISSTKKSVLNTNYLFIGVFVYN